MTRLTQAGYRVERFSKRDTLESEKNRFTAYLIPNEPAIASEPLRSLNRLEKKLHSSNSSKKKPISRAQLKKLSDRLIEVLKNRDLPRLLLDKLLTLSESEAPDWQTCYEHEPIKLVAVAADCFNLQDALNSASTIQDLFKLEPEMPSEEWIVPCNPAIHPVTAVGVLLAFVNDIECQARHGTHMNTLLKQGRLGDDKAFLKALEIDSAVMGCKDFAKRLRKEYLKEEKPFLHKCKLKMDANNQRHEMHRKQMRMILKALDENGQLTQSNEELHTLFINLGINPANTDNRDNIKTLKTNLLKNLRNST